MAQNDVPTSTTAHELLSQKEYADRKGWSKQYVNQLVKKGKIQLQNGKIDPQAADAALQKDQDPAQDPAFSAAPLASEALPQSGSQLEAAGLHGSFARARTVREHYRALQEQTAYEREIGKLVLAQDVEDAAYEAGRDLQECLGNAAVRLSEVIAGKFGLDQSQIEEAINLEFHAFLEELSRRFTERCLEFKGTSVPEPDQ